jgi:septal ring factor EnvC (AmiA/AmiB activator)
MRRTTPASCRPRATTARPPLATPAQMPEPMRWLLVIGCTKGAVQCAAVGMMHTHTYTDIRFTNEMKKNQEQRDLDDVRTEMTHIKKAKAKVQKKRKKKEKDRERCYWRLMSFVFLFDD